MHKAVTPAEADIRVFELPILNTKTRLEETLTRKRERIMTIITLSPNDSDKR